MPTYPGATVRIVPWANERDDNTTATVAILHLTASEATSQYAWFMRGTACSHFHVDRAGRVEQYIDSNRLSAAEGEGSDNAWSIETQGADANGWWTEAQVESIARILAWLHKTHGLVLAPIGSSRVGERGVGWHRLGIDGNFPELPSPLAGRLQRGGGERWSSSRGKVCPGDRRITQVPGIIARARQIVDGTDPAPEPIPEPEPKESNMIIRRASDGASFVVLGGRGSRLAKAADSGAYQTQGELKVVNLSDEGYAIAEARYLKVA